MQLSLYEWVYIITNIFWTYIIYRFMEVFFDTKKTRGLVEFLSYAAYYAFVTITYLMVNIPIILMFSNLVAFFVLSYNYESKVYKRILSAIFIYLILFFVEMTVVLVSGYFNFPVFSTNNYSSVFGLIVCRIISYLLVLILNNYKHIKQGETVPISYWLSIIIIPVSSIYIVLLLFQAQGLSAVEVMVSLILLFLINFSTFHLYDVITAALSEKMQSLLILEQNKYYDRQFELIKTSLHTTRIIKHDLKNHMFALHSLIERGDKEETLAYISGIMEEFETKHDYANTGNTIIDSIINFKFQVAEHRGIKTNLELNIPEKLEIPSFDMTIILGNLLDNAINATSEVKENRYISFIIKYDKGRLLIQSENPYEGQINDESGKLMTTNHDTENHGIGLESIKKVIQKYDGTMNIDYSNNLFSVSLLMYLD